MTIIQLPVCNHASTVCGCYAQFAPKPKPFKCSRCKQEKMPDGFEYRIGKRKRLVCNQCFNEYMDFPAVTWFRDSLNTGRVKLQNYAAEKAEKEFWKNPDKVQEVLDAVQSVYPNMELGIKNV